MNKKLGYITAFVVFFFGSALIDRIFNLGFSKELNLSNALVTAVIGFLIVVAIEEK